MQPRLTGIVLATAILAFPLAAFAGGKAVIEAKGAGMPGRPHPTASRMTVSWRDANTARIQEAGQKDYLLLRNGKAYSVNYEAGHARVMDMRQVFGFMHRGGQKKNSAGKIDKVTRTGRSQTVAGIRGDVYRVTAEGANGKPKTQEWVLTDNPTVVAVTTAYMNAVKGMFPAGHNSDFVRRWQRGLAHAEKGILKAGDSYRIVSVSDTAPPASRFALPAKPMNMQQMMGGH